MGIDLGRREDTLGGQKLLRESIDYAPSEISTPVYNPLILWHLPVSLREIELWESELSHVGGGGSVRPSCRQSS